MDDIMFVPRISRITVPLCIKPLLWRCRIKIYAKLLLFAPLGLVGTCKN
jgi:hypothetical protein